jgi:hypothetical protein
VIEEQVKRELDLELPRLEECFALIPDLLRMREKGVRVCIALPFEHDPDFPERAWDLEPYLDQGIDVRWASTVHQARMIADGRQLYRVDGGLFSPDAGLENSLPTVADGQLKILSGEVLEKQSRYARFDRLDRLVFVRLWALGGRFPIFFSSERTPVDALSPGDHVKVLLVINWSGSGLFSAFVPSELYYEGIDVKQTAGAACE